MPELVAIDVDQGPAIPRLLMGVWARGDAACVVDRRLNGPARAAALAALRPTRRIVDGDGTEVVESGGEGVERGDALVVTTSGSSATPRAVVLTHDAVAASARATSTRLGVDPTVDMWLCCLPCAHVGGLSVVTRALLTDTPLEVHRTFDADEVARAARRGATLVSLVAATLGDVVEPAAFRTILLGGAAPPRDVPSNAVVTWGMTETGSGVVYDGVPLEGVVVAALDGELYVKGPTLARAYRDGSPTTGTGPDGTTGWLATGDAGSVARGVVEVRGRVAEVINTGGEKVWPAEVEAALAAHPSVSEVAVWKRPDERWGERVVAWVVPRGEPPSLGELHDLVTATLPAWAAPKQVVVVAGLPRSSSGKVVRRLLDSADTA